MDDKNNRHLHILTAHNSWVILFSIGEQRQTLLLRCAGRQSLTSSEECRLVVRQHSYKYGRFSPRRIFYFIKILNPLQILKHRVTQIIQIVKMVVQRKSSVSNSVVIVAVILVVFGQIIGPVHGGPKDCVKWCDSEYVACVNQGEKLLFRNFETI